MRPNPALGPIDSVARYLLCVSIVVLGVLLPILAQKWRQRRQDAALTFPSRTRTAWDVAYFPNVLALSAGTLAAYDAALPDADAA